jgi:hypothetical protein
MDTVRIRQECAVFWKDYVAATLTNLPLLLQNPPRSELNPGGAVRASRHLAVIRR